MEQAKSTSRAHCSGSTPSHESCFDLEKYCCNHSCQPLCLNPMHLLGSTVRVVLHTFQWLTPIQCLPTSVLKNASDEAMKAKDLAVGSERVQEKEIRACAEE